MLTAHPLITRLEGYVNLAKDSLNVAPADFGIKEIRKKIRSKDVEGLLDKLAITLTHTSNNMAALTAQGFTPEALAQLQSLTASIRSSNLQQNLKMDEKEAGVQANLQIITELWMIIAEILDVGKRLYKYDNKEKAGDYTATVIKSRIRHERAPASPHEPSE
ncbi:MAG: hypothetical protein R2764_20460 [Bacteroidales bacterium]